MKYLTIVFLFALLISCKKHEVSPESLTGTWEEVTDAASAFKARNGYKYVFTDHDFQWINAGKAIASGTYRLVKDSTSIDGITFTDQIFFGNNEYPAFIKISGSKLYVSTGSIALDGHTSTYQKR